MASNGYSNGSEAVFGTCEIQKDITFQENDAELMSFTCPYHLRMGHSASSLQTTESREALSQNWRPLGLHVSLFLSGA